MGLIVNLGCGQKPKAGAVNVDAVAMPGVDVVHDLDTFPWPWETGAVDEIHAHHVYEHLLDPLGFMEEAHRVLKPGGLLHVEVPHWQSMNAYTDPTHRRYCTEETFLYWVPGSWLWKVGGVAYHRNRPFRKVAIQVVSGDLIVDLRSA